MMPSLRKNKKLALSIAVSLLSAYALSTLFCLVYPRLIYELDSVSNLRNQYSVRTYRKDFGSAYFEVLRGYRRLYSYSGKHRFFVEILGPDITGNGVANLVIRQWQGSAHGDSRYLVLELCNGHGVSEIDVIDGLLSVELADVNNDGMVEITGLDKTYSYFQGDSFAASPLPRVVLSFDETQARFVPDRKLMSKRPLSREEFDRLSSEFKKDARWHEQLRPPSGLFLTVLELVYSGNEEQAWELFDASWPDVSEVSKEQYRQALENNLRHSPTYSVIARK